MSTTMTTTQHEPQQKNRKLTESNGDPDYSYQPTFSPRFDIWEGDEELVLYGDLPGVDADNLEISFENRQLSVHGKIRRSQQRECSLYEEYQVGDFHRRFSIGETIDAAAISAELRDGVLILRLPKAEEAKPRRIKVKTN